LAYECGSLMLPSGGRGPMEVAATPSIGPGSGDNKR
ncbi:hypothetical protein FOPG_19917, partial [Fusarium oxysporum f. sp. conglutinans race 2 54008]